MTALSALLVSLPLAADAAEEGKKIITWMLLTGLAFLVVIAVGELFAWRRRRQYHALVRRLRAGQRVR